MSDRIAGSRLAIEIGAKLGLDMTRVTCLKIIFQAGAVVDVEVSRLVTEGEVTQMGQVMQKYRLVPKE